MSAPDRSSDPAQWVRIRHVEARLGPLCQAARQLLSVACADNGASERVRLRDALVRGDLPQPEWETRAPRKVKEGFRLLDTLRGEIQDMPGAPLYEAKFDELELDLALLEAAGDTRRMRALVKRRFASGDTLAPYNGEMQPLARVAAELLRGAPQQPEARTLEATSPGDEPSLARLVHEVARAGGLDVEVQVEPRLAAGAATGERTVFIADRRFGVHEAVRLAVHEVLGHLTVAANGRAQPMRLLEWGTAGSFGDQEGVALCLEEIHGLLDPSRLRTLAGRVVATDRMHAEASFGETARLLHRTLGFGPEESIAICERAYRGGGLARDASYLFGYLRVREALVRKQATVDELRMGRVSLDALPVLRALVQAGYARRSVYRPSLSRSFLATMSGTTLDTSPPRTAASFTRLELT